MHVSVSCMSSTDHTLAPSDCSHLATKRWAHSSQAWWQRSKVSRSRVFYSYTVLTKCPANKEEHGFLGSRSLVGAESATNNETMTIMYFKSSEHVQAFAASPLHRKSLGWWAKHAAEYPHLGIFHETYQVQAKNYETVYAHTKPMLAGATQHRVQGGFSEKGEEEAVYRDSLVYAKGVLRTSLGRMGRLPGTFDRSILEVKEAGKAGPMMDGIMVL
jgi:heme-degrading monooxygenase HmoA